jgi:FkbM family methyltransferase
MFCAQYPRARVLALEPAREAFELLVHNTKDNFPNVIPFQIGAFDRDAEATMHLGVEASVTNSIVANTLTGTASETIRLRRLSAFLAEEQIDHVSLLKLDTEGAEVPILNDLRVTGWLDGGGDGGGDAKIDAMFVEYHSETDRLEIDRILCGPDGAYVLFTAGAQHAHRGLMCYASKRVLSAKTSWNTVALQRPSL